jgi:hypoxanthine-guanine phosphoribosyltransferase
LIRKRNPKIEVPIKYVGFEIDKNDFVVGYGLDYAGMCVC